MERRMEFGIVGADRRATSMYISTPAKVDDTYQQTTITRYNDGTDVPKKWTGYGLEHNHHSDVDTTSSSLYLPSHPYNRGEIFRFVPRPIRGVQVTQSLAMAMSQLLGTITRPWRDPRHHPESDVRNTMGYEYLRYVTLVVAALQSGAGGSHMSPVPVALNSTLRRLPRRRKYAIPFSNRAS
ncbi:hypothetical protein BDV25DRAFT_137379 [Aspergillus avenaceus]|uniref:Uncharacterized protein n=1 Tax=Aspergillus avenaceus TaxID=36643 RepID=A0A5N6U2X7_ASPAV|nr:hypothetical protein BDV25DRAFT_137379 [Aspergillus avenaceus]